MGLVEPRKNLERLRILLIAFLKLNDIVLSGIRRRGRGRPILVRHFRRFLVSLGRATWLCHVIVPGVLR